MKDTAKTIIKKIYVICTFLLLDVWLRYMTKKIGAYSLFALEPNLFTLCWAFVLTSVLYILPQKARGILYGIFYYLSVVYAVVQYGTFLILGKFLYASDFLFASEGLDYTSYIIDFIDVKLVLQILLLIAVGGLGIIVVVNEKNTKRMWETAGILFGIAGIILIPNLYEEGSDIDKWDAFRNPEFEYERFTNPCFDMELTGMYQYFVHDIHLQTQRKYEDHEEEWAVIDAYFEEKEEHQNNEYTGIFEGKNVIIVMMESVDDWLINEEDTPVLSYMMDHAICFDEFYTPSYSNGYTFNTEFAFNISVYPYSNGNVAYSLTENNFSYSMASIFKDAGYSVESFHEGNRTFYNRGSMHETFGYERYRSYRDYSKEDISVQNDLFLTESDQLYSDLTSGTPFCSYVITYTPHLPYTMEDELAQEALAKYPQYAEGEISEADILRAKTRITDDMFRELLTRLESDGLLGDTIIVGFADHYAYGIDDDEFLQQVSEEAGCSILEKTPAFAYSSEMSESIHIDKVMQTTDLGPTILNLFGLEVPKEIMGSDIFDPAYEGFGLFAGDTWLTKETYVKDGKIVWNNGMSEEEMKEINDSMQKMHEINDSILNSDYYRQLSQK